MEPHATIDAQVNRQTQIPIDNPQSEKSAITNRKTAIVRVAYRLTEIMTVFRKASPMLSDDISGSSATVRWTRRRAYGFSGPISWGPPVLAFSIMKRAI